MKDWHSSSHPQSLQGFHFQTTWKPQESLIWLFYYSLSILHDILSKGYLLQYACFVEAIVLFCSDSIADEDIALTEQSLSYVVYMCPHYSTGIWLCICIHSCTSMCKRSWSSMGIFMFPYEDANGSLFRLSMELRILKCKFWVVSMSFKTFQHLTDQITDSQVLDFILAHRVGRIC